MINISVFIIGLLIGFSISEWLIKRRATVQSEIARDIIINEALYSNYEQYKHKLN